MLKSFEELNKIDVLPFCEYKKAKDEDGNKIELAYLNWAMCKKLLHDNGAKVVYFEPLTNEDGSSLFMSSEMATDKNGLTNRCYEVKVKIVIDELEFIQTAPLLNGTAIVRNDTLNQLRVWNAQCRAFVKGVAIRTGLGFSLWLKETEEDRAIRTLEEDDLSKHSLFAIKKRIEEELTAKIVEGKMKDEVLKAIGLNEKQFSLYMGYFESLNKLEQAINGIK